MSIDAKERTQAKVTLDRESHQNKETIKQPQRPNSAVNQGKEVAKEVKTKNIQENVKVPEIKVIKQKE